MARKEDFYELPEWLQEMWKENPSIARRAEKDWKAMMGALKSMLYVFDRGLEDGTMGRAVCDEAIAAMKGQTE